MTENYSKHIPALATSTWPAVYKVLFVIGLTLLMITYLMVSHVITHPDIIGERYNKIAYRISETPDRGKEGGIIGMYLLHMLYKSQLPIRY